MADILDSFSGSQGTTIGNHTSESAHSYEANNSLVFNSTGGLYLSNSSGAITSEILGHTTTAAYDIKLDVDVKSNLGNVGIFIGDPIGLDGYLYQRLVYDNSIRTRVLSYVGGSFDGAIIDSLFIGTFGPENEPTSATGTILEVRSAGFNLKDNGVLVDTGEDTTHAKSGHKLHVRSSQAVTNTTGYHFDYLAVTEVDADTPLNYPDTPPYTTGTYNVSVESSEGASGSGTMSIYEDGAYVSGVTDDKKSGEFTPRFNVEFSGKSEAESAGNFEPQYILSVSANIIDSGDIQSANMSSLSAITLSSSIVQIGDTIAASLLVHNGEVLPYFSKSGIIDITPKYGVKWL